ncbi:MAG: hypothetical protein ACYDCO_07720 [Armatimonadota bacterium]
MPLRAMGKGGARLQPLQRLLDFRCLIISKPVPPADGNLQITC